MCLQAVLKFGVPPPSEIICMIFSPSATLMPPMSVTPCLNSGSGKTLAVGPARPFYLVFLESSRRRSMVPLARAVPVIIAMSAHGRTSSAATPGRTFGSRSLGFFPKM